MAQNICPFLRIHSLVLEGSGVKAVGLCSTAPRQDRRGGLSLYLHPAKPCQGVVAASAQGNFSLVSPGTILPTCEARDQIMAFWQPSGLPGLGALGSLCDFVMEPTNAGRRSVLPGIIPAHRHPAQLSLSAPFSHTLGMCPDTGFGLWEGRFADRVSQDLGTSLSNYCISRTSLQQQFS